MTSTSASPAADGCCCRMTWWQFCPTLQLQVFFFLEDWSKFLFITSSDNMAFFFFFYYTHCICIPFQNWQRAIFMPSGCALQIKGSSALLCRLHSAVLTSSTSHHVTVHIGNTRLRLFPKSLTGRSHYRCCLVSDRWRGCTPSAFIKCAIYKKERLACLSCQCHSAEALFEFELLTPKELKS